MTHRFLPEHPLLVHCGNFPRLYHNYGLRPYRTFWADTVCLQEKDEVLAPNIDELLLERLASILRWEGFWFTHGFPFNTRTGAPMASIDGRMEIYAIATTQDGDFSPHYARAVSPEDERLSDELRDLLDRDSLLNWEMWRVYGSPDRFRAHAPTVSVGDFQVEGTFAEVCEGILAWEDSFAPYVQPFS